LLPQPQQDSEAAGFKVPLLAFQIPQSYTLPPDLPVEFPGVLAYPEYADEFVRLSCRDCAGWRRDEWAYSPLFICGKFQGFSGIFSGKSAL
jgi:hypothetical protein